MPMTVTDLGIAASRAAEQGGFLINLSQFSLTEAAGFELKPDREALIGEEKFRADITSIEDIDGNTIRLTCYIPAGRPATGQWNFGEIGIWNSTGQLFAHGSFQVFPKTPDFGLKFYVYVSMARIGTVINVTTSDQMSLPSAARVSRLLPPTQSRQNAVVALDGNAHQEEIAGGMPNKTASPTLAFKHGPGGTQWGFAGYARVYQGVPDSIVNASAFNLDASKAGFWLTDGEVVIVQIDRGAGAGQTRKMQFNGIAKRFTSVDDPFTSITPTSRLQIWRSNESALPARHAGIPDYMVMGVGQNTYQTATASTTASRLVPRSYQFTSNGSDTHAMTDHRIPLSALDNKNMILVTVNGIAVNPDGYLIQGNSIRFPGGLPSGSFVVMWCFLREAPGGGEMVFQEAAYDCDGRLEYDLPIVPESKDNIFIVSNSTQFVASHYELLGAKIRFNANQQPRDGTKIWIIAGGNLLSEEVRGTMTRETFNVSSQTVELVTSAPISGLRNTLVFVNGTYLPRISYRIDGTKIILRSPIANSRIDVMNFRGETTTSIVNRSGLDTGPQWIDPAGSEGVPNKIIPVRRTYQADGRPNFEVATVPNVEHLAVFIHDRYVPSTEYIYDGHYIWPKEIVTSGRTVDIICFTSIDHPGTHAAPRVTRLFGNGTRGYTIHAGADVASLIVAVAGTYVPRTQYTYVPGTGVLTFNTPVQGSPEISAWSYADRDDRGKQVRVYSSVQPVTNSRSYVLKGPVHVQADVVPFIRGEAFSFSAFSVATRQNFSYFEMSSNPNPSQTGLDFQLMHFSTREPKTRLVLRTELDDLDSRYLSTGANLADVRDKAAARANLGIDLGAIGAGMDAALMKAQNLADVPNKPLARDNLGITPLIQNILNQMLVKSSNLADVPDKAAARANLGIDLGGIGGAIDGALMKAANLADVPNKAAARDNLGITGLIQNILNQMLYQNNNLADVPDKAAARANLGINLGDMGVQTDFSRGQEAWWVKVGPLYIQGGRVSRPGNWSGEGIGPSVNFPIRFPNACLTVQTTDHSAGSILFDVWSQVYGAPTQTGFQIFRQAPSGNAQNWYGCNWLAFGF